MKRRIFECSLYGTLVATPAEDIPLSSEEMLPVISNEGDDSAETPHISRGGDVTIISSQNLRSQVTDCPVYLRGTVVHS